MKNSIVCKGSVYIDIRVELLCRLLHFILGGNTMLYYSGVQFQFHQLMSEVDSHIVYQVSKFRQVNFRCDPTLRHKIYSVLGGNLHM